MIRRFRRTSLAVATLLAVATAVGGNTISPPAHADADPDAPLNAAAALAINVPGSVLADAAPSTLAASRLASAQTFDWRFTDARFAAVSGTLTASPTAATSLTAAEQAAWASMVKNFSAPAVRGAPVARASFGQGTVVVLAFELGLLVGNGAARVAGFKSNDVCKANSDSLTALASVLNGTDCSAYNNAMTQVQRNSDQVPVSTMPTIAYRGITAKYKYGMPYPSLDNNLLTCFKYTGKASTGWTFRGVEVWGADGSANGTGTGLANPNCGSSSDSNLSGWWIKAPLLRYRLAFSKGSVADYSPVGEGTYTVPNPVRRFQCVIQLSGGGQVAAESSPYTEQAPALSGIECPTVPEGEFATNLSIGDYYSPDGDPYSYNSEELVNVPTTGAYQSWAEEHPECANGSCLTDLRKDGVSCFRQTDVHACANWLASTDLNTHYKCYVGTQVVALSECFVYARVFNGTSLDDGHGYADPSTGDTQTEQTSPTKRQRLSAACKALLSRTPQSGTGTVASASGVSAASCDSLPIYMPGNDLQEATRHRLDAILEVPARTLLNYEDSATKLIDVQATSNGRGSRDWYNLTNECPVPKPDGMHCDEFPNWVTVQGAQVEDWTASPLIPRTSLRLIPAADNTREGGYMNSFRTQCGLSSASSAYPAAPGSAFLEIPNMAAAATEWVCE